MQHFTGSRKPRSMRTARHGSPHKQPGTRKNRAFVAVARNFKCRASALQVIVVEERQRIEPPTSDPDALAVERPAKPIAMTSRRFGRRHQRQTARVASTPGPSRSGDEEARTLNPALQSRQPTIASDHGKALTYGKRFESLPPAFAPHKTNGPQLSRDASARSCGAFGSISRNHNTQSILDSSNTRRVNRKFLSHLFQVKGWHCSQ